MLSHNVQQGCRLCCTLIDIVHGTLSQCMLSLSHYSTLSPARGVCMHTMYVLTQLLHWVFNNHSTARQGDSQSGLGECVYSECPPDVQAFGVAVPRCPAAGKLPREAYSMPTNNHANKQACQPQAESGPLLLLLCRHCCCPIYCCCCVVTTAAAPSE